MITYPTLLLDEEKCRENIAQMAEKARNKGLIFRPHFKTHQSLEIGRWFKEEGVQQITVSSLRMAEYFSSEWKDITVAFPVNLSETDTIKRLAANLQLNILVESAEAIHYLGQKLTSSLGFFIKTDTGYHRTGIDSKNLSAFETLLEAAKPFPQLQFKGFLTHNGHSYKCRNGKGIEQIHQHSLGELNRLKKIFRSRYLEIINSLGDTPTCSVCENFEGIDEIRPGNFVFYDLTQVAIGSCKSEQIAVALACPIVALHPEREEMVLYGGGVHFSKDRLETEQGVIYGQLAEKSNHGWGKPIEGVYLKSLSQEHGIVHVPQYLSKNFKIDDWMNVLPVHSCMTADLMKNYLTLEKRKIKMMPPLGMDF